MLKTEAWCMRISAANATWSPRRARASSDGVSAWALSNFTARPISRLGMGDPRDAELSFDLRELVDVDVPDDVHDGERARFAGDHRQAQDLVPGHVEKNVDVFLRLAPMHLRERAPARTRELPAHRLHVVL